MLVDDLTPIAPVRPMRGLALAALATMAAMLMVALLFGWREDVMAGRPSPIWLLRCGTLLLLGAATAHAVVAMARPAVGRGQGGWQGAVAAAALFPASAAILILTGHGPGAMALWRSGVECLIFSLVGALMVTAPIIWELRRGAPVAANRAGWLTGMAGGALGAFSYNLACPHDNIAYIGLWFGLAVGTAAVLGRLVVPPLIRW